MNDRLALFIKKLRAKGKLTVIPRTMKRKEHEKSGCASLLFGSWYSQLTVVLQFLDEEFDGHVLLAAREAGLIGSQKEDHGGFDPAVRDCLISKLGFSRAEVAEIERALPPDLNAEGQIDFALKARNRR